MITFLTISTFVVVIGIFVIFMFTSEHGFKKKVLLDEYGRKLIVISEGSKGMLIEDERGKRWLYEWPTLEEKFGNQQNIPTKRIEYEAENELRQRLT